MLKRCLGCMQTYEGGSVCPHCGYVQGTPPEEAIHMMPGRVLHGRYTVGRTLGYGGFGATYIGYDEVLQQRVAIKEYMPSEFATRVPGESQVIVFEGDKTEQFRDGMKKFVEEAKRLAKFQKEPGIITIFDAFEENGTAYNIMEYMEGETLASYMERMGTIPEDTAVAIMTPIMESLKTVHAAGILHRDIAPENIFLSLDGRVKLIDFGASRYATTSHSRSLTVIIKPGYTPEEQYRSRGDQGPYTDVYAVAATLYKMITGKTPPDALERRAMYENKNKDILIEPHKLNKDISQVRENALLNALNVKIEDRTPDITSFLEELNADEPAKRRYGSIRQMNFFKMPLWMKIAVPAALALFMTFALLMAFGVIRVSKFSQKLIIPDGVTIVPEVEQMASKDAISLIENNSLLAVTAGNVESEYIPAGTIVFQTPTGGSYINFSGRVELTVSSGKAVKEAVGGIATVPYLLWSSLEDAVEKLKTAGLGEPIIEEVYDDNVAAGQIISQSVDFGEEVDEGTVLTLQVSLGPKAFEMPDLTGMTAEEAQKKLKDLGLSAMISYIQDDSVPEGKVVKQDVAPGASVHRGDAVVITASVKEDTVKVADVSKMSGKDAEKALKAQGFKVTVLENFSDTIDKGEVISQNPQSGTELKKGGTVTVYVSKGSETAKESSSSATPAPEPTPSAPKTFTVTFDGNGGSTPASISVTEGKTYGSLPSSSRAGYIFIGWFTSKTGGSQVSSNTAAGGNVTLYAHWKAEETKPAPQTFTVSFDGNGGDTPAAVTVTQGSTYSNLPSISRSGYVFKGWFTAKSGGDQISNGMTVNLSGNIKLYAQWKANAVTVTFDPQGGTVSEGSRAVSYGEKYGTLPTPKRPYYTFTGWFTGPNGTGSAVSADTKVTSSSDFTLYAGWTMKGYTVSWNDDPHCVIRVERTAGSSAGVLSNGAVIFAGDVLSVSYQAKEGYYVEDHGPSEISVSGNVTSDKIYAITAADEYFYTLVYAAESGAQLGTEDVPNMFGSSATYTPPDFSGFDTPAAQTITWDQTSKTVYFTYLPVQSLITWNDASNVTISVSRTSSPYKGAATGSLSKGSAVYYGDTIQVSYTPASGYNLSNYGSTSITVGTTDINDSYIYASAGVANVTVPNFSGKSLSEAQTWCANNGITANSVAGYMWNVNKNVVVSNDSAGSSVPVGSTITIRYSQGPKPFAVGDKVWFSGTYYGTSGGGGGQGSSSGKYMYISIIADGKKYPYNIGTSKGAHTGWTNAAALQQRSGNTW